MELEITPEPTPEERAAIERALARVEAPDGRQPASEWWREGLREALGEGPGADPAPSL